jgi:hypothetical protein
MDFKVWPALLAFSLLLGCGDGPTGINTSDDPLNPASLTEEPSQTIVLTPRFPVVHAGDTIQFALCWVLPEGGTWPMENPGNVTWKSDNPDLATVDADGMVQTHADGLVTITATRRLVIGSWVYEDHASTRIRIK